MVRTYRGSRRAYAAVRNYCGKWCVGQARCGEVSDAYARSKSAGVCSETEPDADVLAGISCTQVHRDGSEDYRAGRTVPGICKPALQNIVIPRQQLVTVRRIRRAADVGPACAAVGAEF